MAIGNYEQAIRGMVMLPEAKPIARQLELAVRRLEAMRRDLDSRARSAANQDALFVGLHVAESGLTSLTDAVSLMRETYSGLSPVPEPKRGWFTEDPEVEGPGVFP